MPDEHVSILQSLGVALLAFATVVWLTGLVRLLRRARSGAAPWRDDPTLHALPHQRRTAPHLESVELTPAEKDAFAGLVRQLSNGR
ncbi:hypothetical protein [Streptomyces pseudovenezuelae]|uniref:Uncharacterized protein n=1 Tax=Streptomyces pseudovenezuelae TaxID=67350 RepID=A0ABT6M2I1_9ACTN|nr:hypothetical protein [Streptomyces pseudovenezuelae]MDH6222319.1 hypothetical protein [Streptomyces pseudovenezuelae]